MRSSGFRLLAGVFNQLPHASAHVPSATTAAIDIQSSGAFSAAANGLPSLLSTLVPGALSSSATSSRPVVSIGYLAAQHLSTSTAARHPQTPPAKDASAPSTANPTQTNPSPPAGQTPARPKAPVARPKPAPSAPRSAKDKAPKAPSSKVASLSSGVRTSVQGALVLEDRKRLDEELEGMPVPLLRRDMERLGFKGAERRGAGSRAVQVTGYYIGQSIPGATVDKLVQELQGQPLEPGAALASVYKGHEHTLLILSGPPLVAAVTEAAAASVAAAPVRVNSPVPQATSSPSTATEAAAAAAAAGTTPQAGGAPPQDSGGSSARPSGQLAGALHSQQQEQQVGVGDAAAAQSAEAAVGGAEEGAIRGGVASSTRQQAPPLPSACMAVMLLEYGGVAFFNVPEPLQLAALARVLGHALPAAQQAALKVPRRLQTRAELAAWRQVAAEQFYKEEQLLLVDPSQFEGRSKQRYARKRDDALLIWEWDSINLGTAACVATQSAAIRHYNRIYSEMNSKYETIMLERLNPDKGSSDRWWGTGKAVRKDLQHMVWKCALIRVRLYGQLGLHEPPASTWDSAKHHAVWVAVRQEFELDLRRDDLVEKTDTLKHSCLDIISAQNATFTKLSEMAIIALISVEIVISVVTHFWLPGHTAAADPATAAQVLDSLPLER